MGRIERNGSAKAGGVISGAQYTVQFDGAFRQITGARQGSGNGSQRQMSANNCAFLSDGDRCGLVKIRLRRAAGKQ